MIAEETPLHRRDAETAAAHVVKFGGGLGAQTAKGLIHVIDDEDATLRLLDFLLRKAGYQVERWHDGENFLKHADKSVAACVLLEARLPGIDGAEVQARMMAAGFDFPVIMLSGHGDITLAVQVMKAGAVDFLEKPFDRGTLLRSIEAAFVRIADREKRLAREEWARERLKKLTEREIEVLDGLACGYPNKTIAFDLGISSRTVEIHRASVMAKLEVGNFAESLRIAFAAGLGSEADWREAHGLARKQKPAWAQ